MAKSPALLTDMRYFAADFVRNSRSQLSGHSARIPCRIDFNYDKFFALLDVDSLFELYEVKGGEQLDVLTIQRKSHDASSSFVKPGDCFGLLVNTAFNSFAWSRHEPTHKVHEWLHHA